MSTIDPIKTPFVWFGGKSRAAHLIWPRFGDVPNYVEPFAGSLAVLMRRPTAPGNEIVNDLDCYVANAWRAMKLAPEEVAKHADWPCNEADLHARHRWLHKRIEFRERMENDPDYFDAKIAAWWMWGLSNWIGDNFCRPSKQDALPHLTGGKGVARKVPHLTGGKGVARKVPHLTGGKGVARKVPHLTGGQGVARKVPHLTGGKGDDAPSALSEHGRSRCGTQSQGIAEWFEAIADRLRFTKVVCGDWRRVLTKAATYGNGMTGVLLDPPYDTDGHDDVYGEMSRGVSGAVREWAIENGTNPLLRICLCGYEGEHTMPADWACLPWKATGGYGSQSGNQNASRERLYFSPACLNPSDEFHFMP
jgi:DNA adenine methylase